MVVMQAGSINCVKENEIIYYFHKSKNSFFSINSGINKERTLNLFFFGDSDIIIKYSEFGLFWDLSL